MALTPHEDELGDRHARFADQLSRRLVEADDGVLFVRRFGVPYPSVFDPSGKALLAFAPSQVVRMVLTGQVGRELVGLLNQHGPVAVGLSGEDAGLFTATATNTIVDGEEVDLGLVGEVAGGHTDARIAPRSNGRGCRLRTVLSVL